MDHDQLAYACGVLAGRGFIKQGRNNCVGLQTSNKDLAELFSEALGDIRGWDVVIKKKQLRGKIYFVVNAYGKELVQVFDSLGFTPGRRNWQPPKHAYENQAFRLNFLAGFFDATGFVYFNREKFSVSGSGYRYVRVTSVNAAGLAEIKKLLLMEGVESSLRKPVKGPTFLVLSGGWRLKTFSERVRLRTDKKGGLETVINVLQITR
ncbi:MAG: LAGLIDADG family homing endonuclease [Candidatus Aenigmarchaeota archaeon]|nr:LAGLIDADG family homing endonuclease [Candidatus Aenigmarchaeota archaeon]